MLTLILLLIAGGIMVYLAQNNLMLVPLYLGPYVFSDIPLFYIIIGSLVVGLTFAYVLYLTNAIAVSLKLRKKNNTIKETKSEVVELTKQIHKLELENERLKNNSTTIEPSDKNAL